MKLLEKFGPFIPIVIIGVVMVMVMLYPKSPNPLIVDSPLPLNDIPSTVNTEQTPTPRSCDSWMVNSNTGDCLSIDDWCKEKVGKHSIGKETLDTDPIIRKNPKSSCLCEEGFHFSSRTECIKNCGVGECADDDKCTELPRHAFCNTDLSGNETGDGWHCVDGFVKKEDTCVNKVEVQLYCMNKYGANSKIDDTGNCVCMYGYHLGRPWVNGPIRCVIDESTTSKFPSQDTATYIPSNSEPYIQAKPIYVSPYKSPDIPKAPLLPHIPSPNVPYDEFQKTQPKNGIKCRSYPGLSDGSFITECN